MTQKNFLSIETAEGLKKLKLELQEIMQTKLTENDSIGVQVALFQISVVDNLLKSEKAVEVLDNR
jgi:hypothetical protein